MAVYTVVKEDEFPVAAHRLFKALVLERHQVLINAQPHVFKSGEIIEGDGGVGTVTKTTFVDGHPFKYMLHKFDELDTANSIANTPYLKVMCYVIIWKRLFTR